MGAARRLAQVAFGVALVWAGGARAAPLGCAGDGVPVTTFQPTGFASGQGVLLDGKDAQLTAGDLADGSGFQALTVRLGACGRVETRVGAFFYDVVYEPYDRFERAHADADSWGRFAWAEVGFQPLRWLRLFAGIRRLDFSFGRDEPEGALALPLRPYVDALIAPDRRLGLTLDLDFGAARLVAGVYESARTLDQIGDQGLLLTARAIIEPFGPVGPVLSTVADAPEWRPRARLGIDLSAAYEWTPQVTAWAVEADLPFKIGPLGLTAEYLYADGLLVEGPFTRPVPHVITQGAWVEAAVMAWRPYLEVSARYEWLDVPNLPREQFQALTVGLTAYALGPSARVQLLYSHRFFQLKPAPDDEDLCLLVLTLSL